MDYTLYKGLYWKLTTTDKLIPAWKIIDRKDNNGNAWLFNALIYSLDDCYDKIDNDFKKQEILYLPLASTRIVKYYIGNKTTTDDNIYVIASIINQMNILTCIPLYVGRGFYKIVDGVYTDLLGSIIVPSMIGNRK